MLVILGEKGINFILLLGNYVTCRNRPHQINYVKTLTFKEGKKGHHRESVKTLRFLLESFGQLVRLEFIEEHESCNSNYKQLYY